MTILSATGLDAYLDQTEAALEQQDRAGLGPELIRAGLKSAMQRQCFRADTMDSVHRLFQLWLRARDPLAGLRLLEGDGRAVVAALPLAERAQWHIRLAMWGIDAHIAQGDATALHAALDAAVTLLASLPDSPDHVSAWNYLDVKIREAGAHALERHSAQACHARIAADPAQASFHVWNDARLARRQAGSFWREGDQAQARLAARRAIDILASASAGTDQNIGHDEWIRLGYQLAEIVPDAVAGIVAQARARIPAGSGVFRLREIDVLIARLDAMGLYYQGEPEQALAHMRLGRIILAQDKDDRCNAVLLDWLMQAQRHEDGARLAFESIFHQHPYSAAHALMVTQRALDDGLAGQPYWHLALAFAGMAAASAGVLAGEDEAAYVRRYLALARAHSGAHPAADAIEALLLIKTAGDYHAALPLLEVAVRDISLAHADLVFKLWVARIHVHSAPAALAMPFVPASSGVACNDIGMHLGYALNDVLPEGVTVARADLQALRARYSEAGVARFDAFVASGEGDTGDGNAKVCSALCIGLAAHHYFYRSEPAVALALHRKGHAAAPFPEHLQGAVNCYTALGEHAALIDGAEHLWHFAADHGYSAHLPPAYIPDVVAALHKLGRSADIAIWLQRLDEWWARLDHKQRCAHQQKYMGALVSVLAYMAHTQPGDAILRLDPMLPAVSAAACPVVCGTAAHALRSAGQLARAEKLYLEALGHVVAGNAWHEAQRASILAGLEQCRRPDAQAKPWWKVW
ncbi:hypothetical protein [Massilia sp. CCM 8734]|uniref:hypothetical protein n=1 Tax=Massilia sp. CCM 8734 TaxID=2609283 RepID=UPI00141F8B41|nr:hypothetical protein [Massilia sp. CCM 8734]NHZ96877.1 hypothetical protein [Massilia sp. CCM 8734]